ncbi:MAG: hypothetical protein WCW01_04225 [Gammaproteobacteria bacterium]
MVEKDLKGQEKIAGEHVTNNLEVRKMLQKRGVKPEQLPPSEDTAKIKRKLEREEKAILIELKKTGHQVSRKQH